jgi:hypothetical protein
MLGLRMRLCVARMEWPEIPQADNCSIRRLRCLQCALPVYRQILIDDIVYNNYDNKIVD